MDTLFAMGFDEVSAQAALQRFNGNVDQAIDFLLTNPSESEGIFPTVFNDVSDLNA